MLTLTIAVITVKPWKKLPRRIIRFMAITNPFIKRKNNDKLKEEKEITFVSCVIVEYYYVCRSSLNYTTDLLKESFMYNI